MSALEPQNEVTARQFAREVISKEVEYRRDKQWRIFSWTSGFLLAAIGGVVVLAGKGQFLFDQRLRVLMALALVTIAAYACLWIAANIKFEASARSELKTIDELLQIKFTIPDPKANVMFGYGATVSLLAIAAVLAVLLAPESAPCGVSH
jgi:hypothetical protein